MVTVFGLGFVGLTTALGFAEMGHTVYGVEADSHRLSTIASGKLPFLEPGLDKALLRHLGHNFKPVGDPEAAVDDSEIIYYCVGTPYGDKGEANLEYLFAAIEQTIRLFRDDKFRVLVVKSTIPPSTTRRKIIPFVEGKGFHAGRTIGVANNPEFLREGHCWDDFINADRVVLGVDDPKSEERLKALYKNVKCPVFCVSTTTGEFVKYLSNTLLATLVSYSNEMSVIADKAGDIDVGKSFRILHSDRRWNSCDMTSYVYPGCGYGGYCLPKDTKALYAFAKSAGFEAGILGKVIETNDCMPGIIADKIDRAAGYDKGKVIGVLGLSFKPNSDDVRDSVSAKIIALLNQKGYCNIIAYDPVANDEFARRYDKIPLLYRHSCHELLAEADILVILTAWDEFRGLKELTDKPIVDCRYML
ncbi:MAG: nucleotide sugar dehydrogenase [Synergistaceae bacterium]|jgi:UDPglucose 6-dehydrogenase|nr:nucleotide sugar dehydrogenase [Synergistaceae bacterium]